MKLNLGCGHRPLEGFENVDKLPGSEKVCDLETFPWVWADNSVDEVVLCHVLEHIGKDVSVFYKFMKELYRVCKPEAKISITVPHHRHEFFLADPSHVRPITLQTLGLFSKAFNQSCIEKNAGDSTLGLDLGVDFEVVAVENRLDPRFYAKHGDKTQEEIGEMVYTLNNVLIEVVFNVVVKKEVPALRVVE